jgi:hypothetical protein
MTNTSRTPEQEEAVLRLRRALLSLADQESVVGVKAALALAHWDGVDVPRKVMETINNMNKDGVDVPSGGINMDDQETTNTN